MHFFCSADVKKINLNQKVLHHSGNLWSPVGAVYLILTLNFFGRVC